jgi:hypothetical protein
MPHQVRHDIWVGGVSQGLRAGMIEPSSWDYSPTLSPLKKHPPNKTDV